jgi:hypothetical protein
VQRGRGVLLTILLLGIAAAGSWWYWFHPQATVAITPIPAIVAAPGHYDGTQVTVQGVVASTSDIRLSTGAGSRTYTLREGAAEIVVVARDSLPARGQAFAVTGTVSQPPRGQGLAPRLAESKRARAASR